MDEPIEVDGLEVIAKKVTTPTPADLPVEFKEIAELTAVRGMTDTRVSEITGVPVTAIKRWKKNPAFIEYQNDFVLQLAKDMRAYHLKLCYKMLDARQEKIEEVGDWSLFSSKDSLDIMESMRKITEKTEDKEQSNYVQTLVNLISKSKPSITFNADGGA